MRVASRVGSAPMSPATEGTPARRRTAKSQNATTAVRQRREPRCFGDGSDGEAIGRDGQGFWSITRYSYRDLGSYTFRVTTSRAVPFEPNHVVARAYRYLSVPIRARREVGSTDTPSVRIEVRVELKPGVMDAEAESIEKSLSLLGIPSVRHVTTARIYDLEFTNVEEAEAKRLADEAVERLLANPVIHRVTVRPLSA